MWDVSMTREELQRRRLVRFVCEYEYLHRSKLPYSEHTRDLFVRGHYKYDGDIAAIEKAAVCLMIAYVRGQDYLGFRGPVCQSCDNVDCPEYVKR